MTSSDDNESENEASKKNTMKTKKKAGQGWPNVPTRNTETSEHVAIVTTAGNPLVSSHSARNPTLRKSIETLIAVANSSSLQWRLGPRTLGSSSNLPRLSFSKRCSMKCCTNETSYIPTSLIACNHTKDGQSSRCIVDMSEIQLCRIPCICCVPACGSMYVTHGLVYQKSRVDLLFGL